MEKVYKQICGLKLDFVTNPDFRQFKHGNLKLTDTSLTLQWHDQKIGITLEHYHIRREGWHPVYWGLQIFNQNGTAYDPYAFELRPRLIEHLENHLCQNLGKRYVLDQVETKFGWFAWHCFHFNDVTSDLDHPLMDPWLEKNVAEVTSRLMLEFTTYINGWQQFMKKGLIF